jgi:hypothetical protein
MSAAQQPASKYAGRFLLNADESRVLWSTTGTDWYVNNHVPGVTRLEELVPKNDPDLVHSNEPMWDPKDPTKIICVAPSDAGKGTIVTIYDAVSREKKVWKP